MQQLVLSVESDSTSLRLERGFLVARLISGEISKVALDDLSALLAVGRGLNFTSQLMTALAERSIPLIICGPNFMPVATMIPTLYHERQGLIVKAQCSASRPFLKRTWQQIVRGKIAWQAYTLEEIGSNPIPLQALISKVTSGDPANVEAQAARRYWPLLFGKNFRRDQTSIGLNSALNYGYAVLRSAVARTILGAGLNPSLSVHHQPGANPFALADDLMEIFRPRIDSLVYSLKERIGDDLDREIKSELGNVLHLALPGFGSSSLFAHIQRTAHSLASAYLQGIGSMSVPLPPGRRPMRAEHKKRDSRAKRVSNDVDAGNV